MVLSEVLLNLKKLIKDSLYSKEESETNFKKYYKDNILYVNGKFINTKEISDYKNNVNLNEIIDYSTVNNLNYTYSNNNLTLTGDNYNIEYTLPYNVEVLKGLEFYTRISYETVSSNPYFIGLKNNRQDLNIGFLLEDNQVSFIVGEEVLDIVTGDNDDSDLLLYFKIYFNIESDSLRVAYHIRKIETNTSNVIMDDGFTNNVTVNLTDLEISNYSFQSYNQKNNGFLTVKSMEIYDINTWSDGLRFINNFNLSSNKQNITIDEEAEVNVTVLDQYNVPLPNKTVSFYLNSISDSNLLDTGETDDDGHISTVFSSDKEGTYNILGVVNNVSLTNLIIKVGDYISLDNYIELTIKGDSFNLEPSNGLCEYTGSGLLVDWGDGIISDYDNGQLYHYYNNSSSNQKHTIRICGNITKISSGAFYNCGNLIGVKIPDTVTSLGDSCFRNCSYLSSVDLPSSITEIPVACFLNCYELEYITLPSSITKLKTRCFAYTGLVSINIPKNINTIDANSFSDCESLESVIFPSDSLLTTLSSFTFRSCYSLKSITLPSNITELEKYCFYQSGLEEIIFEGDIESIGLGCFYSSMLKSITIPKTVESIGNKCFGTSSNLKEVYFEWDDNDSILSYNDTWFENISNTIVFYIPSLSLKTNYTNKGYPSDKVTINTGTKTITPLLDGTDTLVSWANATNTTGNGIYTSHGGYLGQGWSNTGLWSVEFDYKYTTTTYIGTMFLCTPDINPFTDAKRNSYSITTWEGSFPPSGDLTWVIVPSSFTKPSQTAWNHILIEKLDNTRIRMVLNDTYTWEGILNQLSNWSILYLGSRDNPASTQSRSNGGNVQYKNIIIKEY